MDCVFCKIRDNVIPSEKFYEDDLFFVIKDLNPQAKLHYLAIPKKHFKFLADMDFEDVKNLGKIFKKIAEISGQLGFKNGYRLLINQGDDAEQTVPHLHIHIVGGEKMGWNPAGKKE